MKAGIDFPLTLPSIGWLLSVVSVHSLLPERVGATVVMSETAIRFLSAQGFS